LAGSRLNDHPGFRSRQEIKQTPLGSGRLPRNAVDFQSFKPTRTVQLRLAEFFNQSRPTSAKMAWLQRDRSWLSVGILHRLAEYRH
jgi:hypothetical protein